MPEEIPQEEETNRDSSEPLMERGNWLACFIDMLKFDDEVVIRRIVIGMYETAQEAFNARYSFTMPAEVTKQPNALALEMLGYGVYPDCIKHQYTLYWIDDLNNYLDDFGITRESYLLRRENGE